MTVLKDNANVTEENQKALETLLNNQTHSCLVRENKMKQTKPPQATNKQPPPTTKAPTNQTKHQKTSQTKIPEPPKPVSMDLSI